MRKRQRKIDEIAAAAAKRAAGLNRHVGKRGTLMEAEWKRQMAEIPDDTRDLTARTFGDPLPGRSALDRKHSSLAYRSGE